MPQNEKPQERVLQPPLADMHPLYTLEATKSRSPEAFCIESHVSLRIL